MRQSKHSCLFIFSRLLGSTEMMSKMCRCLPQAFLLLGTMRRPEGICCLPSVRAQAQLGSGAAPACGALQVPKDGGLSRKALLEWGCLLKVTKPLFLQVSSQCICFLELAGCREPKPTFTPWLEGVERRQPRCRKEKTPNLFGSVHIPPLCPSDTILSSAPALLQTPSGIVRF